MALFSKLVSNWSKVGSVRLLSPYPIAGSITRNLKIRKLDTKIDQFLTRAIISSNFLTKESDTLSLN